MGTLICGENKMDTGRCIKRIQSWYNYSKANQDTIKFVSLQWGHNKRYDVTGHCEGNSPVTGEFPSQRASNEENFSIWWRHHEYGRYMYCDTSCFCIGIYLSIQHFKASRNIFPAIISNRLTSKSPLCLYNGRGNHSEWMLCRFRVAGCDVINYI